MCSRYLLKPKVTKAERSNKSTINLDYHSDSTQGLGFVDV